MFMTLMASGQARTPQAKQGDIWKVGYRVSVIGEFSKEPEPGKDKPTVYYHIRRVYTGNAKLTFSNKHSNPRLDVPLFKDLHADVQIDIDDFVNTLYSPICGVYESTRNHAKVSGLTVILRRRLPHFY